MHYNNLVLRLYSLVFMYTNKIHLWYFWKRSWIRINRWIFNLWNFGIQTHVKILWIPAKNPVPISMSASREQEWLVPWIYDFENSFRLSWSKIGLDPWIYGFEVCFHGADEDFVSILGVAVSHLVLVKPDVLQSGSDSFLPTLTQFTLFKCTKYLNG